MNPDELPVWFAVPTAIALLTIWRLQERHARRASRITNSESEDRP